MSRRRLALALLLAGCGAGSTKLDAGPPRDLVAPSDGEAGDLAAGADPVVVLETTLGNLVVRLAAAEMPRTTQNFLDYVDSGFYDGTLVHRVIDDWVIQGGGFTSGLKSKPTRAPIALETSPQVKHVHGAISMARTNDPDSATSQWFLCDWPKDTMPRQPASLDGKYAAFGVLIEGFDVLEKITRVMTVSRPPFADVPAQEIVVTRARRR